MRIRVAAPPVDGAANAELVRVIAASVGVAPAQVVVAAGAAGRRKQVRVAGLSSAEIRRRLLSAPADG